MCVNGYSNANFECRIDMRGTWANHEGARALNEAICVDSSILKLWRVCVGCSRSPLHSVSSSTFVGWLYSTLVSVNVAVEYMPMSAVSWRLSMSRDIIVTETL